MLISWCLWTNHRWTNRWSWLDWSSSGGIRHVVLYLLPWHLYTHSILLLMFSYVFWCSSLSSDPWFPSNLMWAVSSGEMTVRKGSHSLFIEKSIAFLSKISIFQAFIRLRMKRWKVMSSPKQSWLWKIGGWIMLPGSWKGSLYGKPHDMMYSAIMYDICLEALLTWVELVLFKSLQHRHSAYWRWWTLSSSGMCWGIEPVPSHPPTFIPFWSTFRIDPASFWTRGGGAGSFPFKKPFKVNLGGRFADACRSASKYLAEPP